MLNYVDLYIWQVCIPLLQIVFELRMTVLHPVISNIVELCIWLVMYVVAFDTVDPCLQYVIYSITLDASSSVELCLRMWYLCNI